MRLGAHVDGEAGVPVGGGGGGEVGEVAEAGVTLGVCQAHVGNNGLFVLRCVARDVTQGTGGGEMTYGV